MHFVSRKSREVRGRFAKEHLDKDQKFLNAVTWSGEKRINLLGSEGITRVWRKVNSGNDYTNIMIWGVCLPEEWQTYTLSMV